MVAASLAAHLVVFAWLGLATQRPTFYVGAGQRPMALQLVRPLRSEPRTARAASTDQKRAPVADAPTPLRPHLAPPTVAAPASPVAAAPRAPATVAPTPPTVGVAPGPLPAAEGGRGVRAMLRATVGCDYDSILHLTAEEKAKCAERFAKQARNAPTFIATPGEKLGGYMEEVRANERKQRYREGNLPTPVVACSGAGSNFGLGCLPADAIHSVKP